MTIRDRAKSLFNEAVHGITLIWADIVAITPANGLKITLAIACTITSIWIGFAYAQHIRIIGWQVWTWLGCVVVTIMLLYRHKGKPTRSDLLIILGLFATALVLRLLNLGSIPGLFHVDELGVARFSRDDLFADPRLIISPFVTGPASQPAMYHYIVHLTMKLFGLNVAGARVSSAVVGSLGVAAVYFMVKNFSGKRVALFSAIFMVFYHFSIHYSRIALNNIWDTLWVPLIIYSFVKGWDEDWIGGAVIAGAALGFSQYFYHGSKLVVFLLLILMISHWKQGGILIRKARFLGAMALVTLCVAGPLIMFSFASPEIFYARLRDDWGWKQQAVQATLREVNYWKYFWYQLLRSLGTYTIYPDPSGFYRPNIPLTAGLSAILLMAGNVIAVIRRNWLPIIWLLLTSLFGGFMLSVPHSSPHYVVAIPAICWLIGLAINWIWESGYAKAAIIVLCTTVAIDLYFYFYVFTYSIPPDFNLPFPP